MKYTDKPFYMEEFLRVRLDLMCERVTKHKFDNLIIIDGPEGYGKSNLAAGVAYYAAWKTGRPWGKQPAFFILDDMLNHATSTKEQVIWWDEAALGALASESYTQVQRKLLKLLMVARKKNHFYVFVIPKFFKLKGDIVDRAQALLHVYSRDDITRGRFVYYTKEQKERLFEHWQATRDKAYTKFYDFAGSFPEALPLVMDEKAYDDDKDKAILSINGKDDTHNKQIDKLKAEIAKIKQLYASIPGKNQQELCLHAHIAKRTLQYWKKGENEEHIGQKDAPAQAQTMQIKGNPEQDGGGEDEQLALLTSEAEHD